MPLMTEPIDVNAKDFDLPRDYIPISKRLGLYNRCHADWWPGQILPERRPRDGQMQKCYDAEAWANRRMLEEQIEIVTFDTVPETVPYLRWVLNQTWFKRRWPEFVSVRLNEARGYTNHGGPRNIHENTGWARWGEITLTQRSVNVWGEMIVLHELAHAMCPRLVAHHRLWARVYLDLVKHYVKDKRVGQYLEEGYKRNNVKYHPCRPAHGRACTGMKMAAKRVAKD